MQSSGNTQTEDTLNLENNMEECNDEVTKSVIRIIRGLINDENIVITKSTSLEQLGFNSIKYVNLIIAFENEYDIEVDDDKLIFIKEDNIMMISNYIKEFVRKE